MLSILTLVPWVLLVASLLFLVRRRPRLDEYPPVPPADDGAAPTVSVIVPTLNDATRIGSCLATLLATDYESSEVVVVDAGSSDGTLEIVESLRRRGRGDLRLIQLEDVPADRPWRATACVRGAREAEGDLLLFTEPGAIHASDLLGRAVTALQVEGADLLTVQPRLVMRGFWERLIMPHVWLVLRARFPSARLVNRSRSPRNAVAHHQFLLFRRAAYMELGGHEVVGSTAIEDLAVPQAVVRAGMRLFLVHGDAYLETRILRTVDDINGVGVASIPPAARSTVAPWAGAFVPWVMAATPLFFFVLPPLLLVAWLLGGVGGAVGAWAFRTSLLSLVFWLVLYGVHRIRPAYAVAYPVGALATAVIFVRSVIRSEPADP